MRVTRSSVGNEIAAKKDHVSHRIPPYGCEPGTITTVDSDLHADAGRNSPMHNFSYSRLRTLFRFQLSDAVKSLIAMMM